MSDLAVLLVALDNDTTAPGVDGGEVSAVTDDAGNVWTKAGEVVCTHGAAADGVVCAMWFCNPATALSIGGHVTASFASAHKASAASLGKWARALPPGGAVAALASSVAVADFPSSIDVATGDESVLRLRGLASRSNLATALTPTSTFDGAVAQAVGSASNAVGIRGESLVTNAASAASHPTLFATDHASVYAAFRLWPLSQGSGDLVALPPALAAIGGVTGSSGSGALVAGASSVSVAPDLHRAATRAVGGKAHAPWQFFAGDTWLIEVQCVDEDGMPYDISTAHLEWILASADRTENFFVLDVGTGIEVTNSLNGVCLIAIAASKTAALAAADYVDQLRIVLGGITMVQLWGVITVLDPLMPFEAAPVGAAPVAAVDALRRRAAVPKGAPRQPWPWPVPPPRRH